MATIAEVAAGFGGALRASGLGAPLASVSCFAQALDQLGCRLAGLGLLGWPRSFVRRPEDSATYATIFASFFSAFGLVAARRRRAAGDIGRRTGGRGLGGRSTTAREVDEHAPSARGPLQRPRGARSQGLRRLHRRGAAEIERLMLAMVHRPSPPSITPAQPHEPAAWHRPTSAGRCGPQCATAGRRRGCYRLGPRFTERPWSCSCRHQRVDGPLQPGLPPLRARHGVGPSPRGGVRPRNPPDPDHPGAGVAGPQPGDQGGIGLGARTCRAAPASATALGAFNDRYGVAGMARGAVVVIFSDGWDRGDPEVDRTRDGAGSTVWRTA